MSNSPSKKSVTFAPLGLPAASYLPALATSYLSLCPGCVSIATRASLLKELEVGKFLPPQAHPDLLSQYLPVLALSLPFSWGVVATRRDKGQTPPSPSSAAPEDLLWRQKCSVSAPADRADSDPHSC